MAFHTLKILTPDINYPIYIGENTLHHVSEFLEKHDLTGRRVIVTNETIRPLYADNLAQQVNAAVVTLPDGELYKNLETVSALYDSFLGLGLDRKSIVIALGGGVIGDTVGFAAATFLRGVSFVQIPTSLLSMVDSSVGGKVGVNVPQGKNLVGAFKQPEMVVIDTALLATLPAVERRCGLAEAIKHGLLADPVLLDPTPYEQPTTEFVARAVQVKIDVVQRDPYEDNIRAWLNLGHTFGQAIEAVSGYQWRHGEAVAVGLCGAVRLSHLYGLCDASLVDQVERLLVQAGLPTRYHDFDPKAIRAAMNSDKKRQNAKVRFVLLKGIAQPDVYSDVPEGLVMQAIEAIRAD
jgi:3-dehydroquinate synthase